MSIRALVILTLCLGLPVLPRAGVADGLLQSLQLLARPLRQVDDLEPLLDAIGDARLVLLGEASHGTREFYTWRAQLSQRLIERGGFCFVAIEGDWSSLLPLDRYVRLRPGGPASARAALLQIERWPRWVWANRPVAAFGEWLQGFNRGRPATDRVAVHGIDLYGIWESLDAVEAYYQGQLPASAEPVRRRYALLRGFRGQYRAYARHVRQTRQSARSGVRQVATDLAARHRAATPADRAGLFEALQHARVVEAGEAYLRTLSGPAHRSWNIRANHFERTLARLLGHHDRACRAIVWAHNTHIGDARATDMRHTGEVNLGQLARERYGRDKVFAVGFATASGTVRAAPSWEAPGQTMQIPGPRPDSLEAALLASGSGDRLLILDRRRPATSRLRWPLPQRAIGVVFDPAREPWKNYVPTSLAERYDALVFLPRTHALAPLPR